MISYVIIIRNLPDKMSEKLPHYDFSREPLKVKSNKVKPKPSEEVDLARRESYLHPDYLKGGKKDPNLPHFYAKNEEYFAKNEEYVSGSDSKNAAFEASASGPMDTQRKLATLNQELIEGHKKVYSAKPDKKLQDILHDKNTKPWEKVAALDVLHDRMINNKVKLQKVTQKGWSTGKEG